MVSSMFSGSPTHQPLDAFFADDLQHRGRGLFGRG